MNHHTRPSGNLERRIRDAERDLFAAAGAEVEEFFLDLARTGLRVRVLSHGRGPAVVLLHGVSESAAIWAPLFPELRGFRLLAVDLPGHGLSDPVAFRRGRVREHASGDPYLSVERARTSIDQIHGARLYEVPSGHAPWLADAQHTAELILTHSHLTPGPHRTPAPGQSRQANAST